MSPIDTIRALCERAAENHDDDASFALEWYEGMLDVLSTLRKLVYLGAGGTITAPINQGEDAQKETTNDE